MMLSEKADSVDSNATMKPPKDEPSSSLPPVGATPSIESGAMPLVTKDEPSPEQSATGWSDLSPPLPAPTSNTLGPELDRRSDELRNKLCALDLKADTERTRVKKAERHSKKVAAKLSRTEEKIKAVLKEIEEFELCLYLGEDPLAQA